jgi:membrane protein
MVLFMLWLISFGLTIIGFFFLYWTIPNRTIPIYSAIIAACFSATLFELLKNIFSFAMSNFTSYELVYGAFAAIPSFYCGFFFHGILCFLALKSAMH